MSEEQAGVPLVPFDLPEGHLEAAEEYWADRSPDVAYIRRILGLPPGDPRIADAVAEAGFGPVPERIEITAGFCQCPACKEARYEP